MKYVIFGVPLGILVILSYLIASICYLWSFKETHFQKGLRFINNETKMLTFLSEKMP